MLKIVSLLAVAGIAGVLALAALRPATFVVKRSTLVEAPPERLHPLINDLRAFNTWNPYNRKDPRMRGDYEGPQAGPGAAFHFAGNKDVGKGSIRIVESQPSRVAMQLHMLEPFEGRNAVEFTLRPQGNATEVTWAMQGASPFVARIVGVFLDMDRMIGQDFEAGLAALKQRAERRT